MARMVRGQGVEVPGVLVVLLPTPDHKGKMVRAVEVVEVVLKQRPVGKVVLVSSLFVI
ncbi:MAG: hypothetical protein NT074_00890 [Methanomicrobiales archaeon]|nr:hypothetical protein [Methanomicrobiales archaeon]